MRAPQPFTRASWREALAPARASGARRLVTTDGREVAAHVDLALTPLRRMRGLIGRAALPDDAALLLAPCAQVHTIGMRFAIDAVFCDADLVVLGVRTLPPGRVSRPVARAVCCLELPAGRAAAIGLRPGDRLRFQTPKDA